MAHSTNYRDTLILPSPDCKADAAITPLKPTTIAGLQFALVFPSPYEMTSDDLLTAVHAERKGVARADRAAFRADFLSRGQPCLRCSPLVKTHGWAIHHDEEARVALVDPASPRFAELTAQDGITVIEGMRNARR